MVRESAIITLLRTARRIRTRSRFHPRTDISPANGHTRARLAGPYRILARCLRTAGALGLLAAIPASLLGQEAPQAGQGAVAVLAAMARTAPFSPSEIAAVLRRATSGQAQLVEVAGEQIKLDAADARLLREVAALSRSLDAVDVRSKSHVTLVDEKGATYLIDLLAAKLKLVQLHPPFSAAETAAIDAGYRDIRWNVTHGGDPPRTISQALLLGIPLEGGILKDPPKPWIAIVPADQSDPAGRCSLYSIRNGGRATLYSVCRAAGSFARRQLSQGEFARISGAGDGFLAAIETEEEIILINAFGQEIVRIPAKNPGLGWIGATDLLVFSNDLGQPDAVVNGRTRVSRPVRSCDGAKLGAIDRFEASAPGKRAAFLLVSGQVVEWDENRECAVPA